MKIVNGIGKLNPDIAIVGEAAGAEEEKQGIPFVGRSGKLLDKLLQELDIKREDCYITNVVKFRPEDNRTPTNKEIDIWKSLLVEELMLVNPKIILTLGTTAFKALSNKQVKISKIRGTLQVKEDDYENILLFLPTFHPNYALRNSFGYDIMKEDFKKALEFIRSK